MQNKKYIIIRNNLCFFYETKQPLITIFVLMLLFSRMNFCFFFCFLALSAQNLFTHYVCYLAACNYTKGTLFLICFAHFLLFFLLDHVFSAFFFLLMKRNINSHIIIILMHF